MKKTYIFISIFILIFFSFPGTWNLLWLMFGTPNIISSRNITTNSTSVSLEHRFFIPGTYELIVVFKEPINSKLLDSEVKVNLYESGLLGGRTIKILKYSRAYYSKSDSERIKEVAITVARLLRRSWHYGNPILAKSRGESSASRNEIRSFHFEQW